MHEEMFVAGEWKKARFGNGAEFPQARTTNFTPFHFLSYQLLPVTVTCAPLGAKHSRYLKYSAECYFHSEEFKYRTKGSTAIAFRGTLRAVFLKAQIS
jgi:hypothetical protein